VARIDVVVQSSEDTAAEEQGFGLDRGLTILGTSPAWPKSSCPS